MTPDLRSSSPSEHVERDAWIELYGGAPSRLRAALGLHVDVQNGATILRAPGVDDVLFNRVIGLGPDTDDATLRALARSYEAEGVRRWFVHVDPRWARELGPRLEAVLGLRRFHRAWLKLERGAAPLGHDPSLPSVVSARPEHADAAAEVLARGFDLPAGANALLASTVGRPRWIAHVALDGAEVVAAGLAFVAREGVYLAMGATAPTHRRGRRQRALVRSRVREGARRGQVLRDGDGGERARRAAAVVRQPATRR
ncbi:MAG: hypothetical protein KC586_07965, partial [Myxococcales bacterium]|nr:hypothetical protein [Myxococcales bacterium]